MDPWTLKPAADHDLRLAERAKSVRREPGLVEAATHWACTSVAGAYLKGLQRMRVEGREHLPAAPPFVLVANHSSHLDALAVGCALPWRLRADAFPVAAGDTFFTTRAATLFSAAAINALPMWRRQAGRHALDDLRARLLRGEGGLILFPEGTRSRTGEMAAFKPGVGMLVAGTPVPVVPCRLTGTFAALPPGSRWPKPGGRISVRIGPPVSFEAVENRRVGWERIASELENAVRGL